MRRESDGRVFSNVALLCRPGEKSFSARETMIEFRARKIFELAREIFLADVGKRTLNPSSRKWRLWSATVIGRRRVAFSSKNSSTAAGKAMD